MIAIIEAVATGIEKLSSGIPIYASATAPVKLPKKAKATEEIKSNWVSKKINDIMNEEAQPDSIPSHVFVFVLGNILFPKNFPDRVAKASPTAKISKAATKRFFGNLSVLNNSVIINTAEKYHFTLSPTISLFLFAFSIT